MLAAEGLSPVLAVVLLGLGILLLGLVGWLDHRTEGRPRRHANWPSSGEERRLMRGTDTTKMLLIDHTGPIQIDDEGRARVPKARPVSSVAATRNPAAKTPAAKTPPPKPVPVRLAEVSADTHAHPGVTVLPADVPAAALTPRASRPRVVTPEPAPTPTVEEPGVSSVPVADVPVADEPAQKMPKGANAALDALFGDILGDSSANEQRVA